MKEEFTALMHAELFEGEVSKDEVVIWGVFGAIKGGLSKEEACKKYGISVEDYEAKEHLV